MELQIFTTLYKNSQRFEETKTQIFHKDPDIEYPVINIHPNIQYQTFHGFGGTFTEASAYCVKQLGEEKGQKLVNEFFSEEGKDCNIPADAFIWTVVMLLLAIILPAMILQIYPSILFPWNGIISI